MKKAHIVVGEDYAFRRNWGNIRWERRHAYGTPLEHIRITRSAPGSKLEAKWTDNPGRTALISASQVVVPWAGSDAFLMDEKNEDRLLRLNRKDGYESDNSGGPLGLQSPLEIAVDLVLVSTGEWSLGVGPFNIVSGEPDAFARVRLRANDLDPQEPAAAYRDSRGNACWPFRAAMELARKFCLAEPPTVLLAVEAKECELAGLTAASGPGSVYLLSKVNTNLAAGALVRRWAGVDTTAHSHLTVSERLRRLVWDAVYALQEAGVDDEAKRLRHVLQTELRGGDAS